jgi:triacylglycerol lipase
MFNHTTGVQPPLALQYGMFVKAAYDVFLKDESNLNPPQSFYPSFPSGFKLLANIQLTDFFGSSRTQRYYGFFATSISKTGPLVIAIRGTKTWEEWWDDFHVELVPFPYAPNAGNVAAGFLDLYETFSIMVPGSKKAKPVLMKSKTELPGGVSLTGPNMNLVMVGHSLGSALVTLYGLDVAATGKVNPSVYTFASPRVGDTQFANAYNRTVATNYRIWNWPDIVPRLPKDPFDNYDQVKGGYEVDSLLDPLTVKMDLGCFHALLTYLYLVGAPASILGSCRV